MEHLSPCTTAPEPALQGPQATAAEGRVIESVLPLRREEPLQGAASHCSRGGPTLCSWRRPAPSSGGPHSGKHPHTTVFRIPVKEANPSVILHQWAAHLSVDQQLYFCILECHNFHGDNLFFFALILKKTNKLKFFLFFSCHLLHLRCNKLGDCEISSIFLYYQLKPVWFLNILSIYLLV